MEPKGFVFYQSVGYEDRIIETTSATPQIVVEKVEKILLDGVSKDAGYLVSVYDYLFNGVKQILCPQKNVQPYSYAELIKEIPLYGGTSAEELENKLRRKFRRTYECLNQRTKEANKGIARIKKLLKRFKKAAMRF